VRFVAAMAVGRLRIEPLADLVAPLRLDRSESVQAAALFALKRCGRTVDLSPLAAMLRSEDPEVKGNAALVLGELGDKSAAGMLRTSLGKGMRRAAPGRARIVELQVAEALVKLGENTELEGIRAALFAPPEEGEVKALACLMCGTLKDGAAVPNLKDMAERPQPYHESAEVRMAATAALARIPGGQPSIEVPLEYVASQMPAQRAQAALTLGLIGDSRGVPVLQKLMADSHPLVQVAAAGAIVRMGAG